MNNILITNIKEIVQIEKSGKNKTMVCGEEMSKMETLKEAYLLIIDGKIASFGKMKDINKLTPIKAKEINASGKMVFPSFCDSHTHLVYAGSREIEYIDKIKGLSYEEIAKRGGGILNSAKR
ncbi:MAG TPA: imidazolonepropionase, partial [Bacteroidales bacterium]|nr:imidazolonepropionase [Bacteroidales bacterium]